MGIPTRLAPRSRPRLETLEDRCLLTYSLQTFDVPTPGVHPNYLTPGSDGAVWFVEDLTDNQARSLGRITPGGQITEIAIPSQLWSAGYTQFGPDGNIWLAGRGGFIGEMTPEGD